METYLIAEGREEEEAPVLDTLLRRRGDMRARAHDIRRRENMCIPRHCEERNFRRRVKYALSLARESRGNGTLTLDESVGCALLYIVSSVSIILSL